MRILVAPDKFKGSLSAAEVAGVMAHVLRERYPRADIVSFPLTDGGDGFVEILVAATGGTIIRTRTTDAGGRPCTAKWGTLGDRKTAVIGISEASGLSRLPLERRHAGRTVSLGTGLLIAKAEQAGYRRLIIGLGGSATNDGGIGLAVPLGFQFLDRWGRSIPLNGFGLARLARIVCPQKVPSFEMLAATDVSNPLYGPDGAAYQYARQKGASAAEIERLDNNLRHLARLVKKWLGHSPHAEPGAGAAGGCGYGLMAFLNARRVSGFEMFCEAIGLERQIQKADLILTGEGHLDRTSRFGKGCFALAQLARKHRKPVWAVCGQITGATSAWPFTRVVALTSPSVSPKRAQRFPQKYLRAVLEKLVEEQGPENGRLVRATRS